MVYYLLIECLVKFVAMFGYWAAVPLMKKGRFSSCPLLYQGGVHLPEIEREPCQVERGNASPNSGLQNILDSQWNFQFSFLLS
ncbi:MAG: hypothetical protein HC781_14370 [Leptolyngbyaceae cyanobacterium CSU_1_4]|nr:hypothetical protein [Leptolyngbyaceae cyanobacterium CSU_1_4]